MCDTSVTIVHTVAYCSKCRKEVPVYIQEKIETYPVLGYPETILANVCICSICGRECYHFEIDDDNLRRSFDQFRDHHNLMYPDEIRLLRKQLGLTTEEFDQVLGLERGTVARFENGALQRPHINDRLLLAQEELKQKEAITIANSNNL